MKLARESNHESPIFLEDEQPKRRSTLVFAGCALLIILGLVLTLGASVMLILSFVVPELADFPVNAYARFAMLCGLTAGLSWVASGIFFYLRYWRLALFLMLLGYGLGAFSSYVTSPRAN